MKPRILIPVPTSADHDYNARSIANYASAVRQAGGDPVELPLNLPPNELLAIARTTQGILLPGSPADVDPARFGQPPAPECAAADPAREAADNLLIEHAERTRTPLLCICFGTQSLNVYRGGTLVQHLAPIPVNHRAGGAVSIAHAIDITPESHLSRLVTAAHTPSAKESSAPYLAVSSPDVGGTTTNPGAPTNPGTPTNPGAPYLTTASSSSDVGGNATTTSPPNEDRDNLTDRNGLLHLNVNSSHHQAIGIPGEGLRIVARSSEDGVIEAVENDPTYRPNLQGSTTTPPADAAPATEPGAPYRATDSSSPDAGTTPTNPGAPYRAASSPDMGSSATNAPGEPPPRSEVSSSEDVGSTPTNAAANEKPHWLLALQWHPERTTDISPTSRAIFQDFIAAASTKPE